MKKGWKTKTLSDVLEVQNGYAFDSKGFNSDKGLPLIRIRSLKAGTETETRFDGDYDKRYIVKAGDLLIGMDGEFGCYEWKAEPALLNQRVCRLQGFNGELVPRFLFYGVNDYLKAIEDVTGFTTVKHLSSKQILGIHFPVPPLAEQQRIVGMLDEAFAGLATAQVHAEKNLQNARALFESHLHSVFTHRGNGWVEKPLGEVCVLVNGRAYNKDEMLSSGKYPLLRVGNFFTNKDWYYSDFELAPDKYCDTGDLLYAWSASFGPRIWAGEKVIYHYHIWKVLPNSGVVQKRFLLHLLEWDVDQIKQAHGTGTTMMHVSKGSMEARIVPIPPLKSQAGIVEKLDSLRTETQRLESLYQQKQAALAALKKSLLHQAFTGEL